MSQERAVKVNKYAGWCEEHNIDHAWVGLGHIHMSDPPQTGRVCTNCGKRQHCVTYPEPQWMED